MGYGIVGRSIRGGEKKKPCLGKASLGRIKADKSVFLGLVKSETLSLVKHFHLCVFYCENGEGL